MSGKRCVSEFDVGRDSLEKETNAFKIFGNHLLLECISNSLGYEDLLNFRVASTTIHWGLLPVFQKRAQLTLSENQGVRGYGLLKELNNSDDYLQNRTGITCLKLNNFNFDDDWNYRNTFWKTRGKFITSLILNSCDFRTVNSFRRFVSCEVFPKLERLTLSNPRFHCKQASELIPPKSKRAEKLVFLDIDSSRPLQVPISWRELFSYFENLQELSLKKFRDAHNDVLEGMFEAFKITRNSGEVVTVPLKALHLDKVWFRSNSFPYPMLKFLEENKTAQCKLARLICDIDLNMDSRKLYQLLTFIKKDLQKLVLTGNGNTATGTLNDFCLPQFKYLEELQLNSMHLEGLKFLSSASCANLRVLFIHETPYNEVRAEYDNLELLKDEREKWIIADGKNLVLHSLESYLCNVVFNIHSSQIINMKQWAPNLTKLLHHLDNENLRTVCQEFPCLRYLYIFKSLVSDTGITGVQSPEDVDDDSVAAFDFDIVKSMESLIDLKHLKVLVIEQKMETYMDRESWNHFILTHRSVYWSFLQLRNLTTLQVSKNAMTPEGIQLLQVSFPGIWREDYISPQDFLKLK